MKRLVIKAGIAAALVLVALGANRYNTPRSIVHVVTILWKEDSTAEQQRASLEGVKKMAAEIISNLTNCNLYYYTFSPRITQILTNYVF